MSPMVALSLFGGFMFLTQVKCRVFYRKPCNETFVCSHWIWLLDSSRAVAFRAKHLGTDVCMCRCVFCYDVSLDYVADLTLGQGVVN